MARHIKRLSQVERTRRALDKAGFLPFEYMAFTSTRRVTPSGKTIRVAPMPLDIPYIKEMIRERARAFRRAIKVGMKIEDYIDMITDDLYGELDLLDEDGNPDPWQYLRRQEDRYKDRHPEYKSPYKAKKKKVDFDRKYNEGKKSRRKTALEEYEKGRGKGW